MNTEPFAQFLAGRELAAAQARIRELEHTVDVLEVCVANYQDAWVLQQLRIGAAS